MKLSRYLWPLLLLIGVSFGQGNGYNAARIFATSAVAADVDVPEQSLIGWHQISWVVTGSPSGCTALLQTSPDNTTWTTLITGTCTTNGNSSISAQTLVNYVRINVTALSGGTTPQVTVTYEGWAFNPNSGGGGGFTPGGDLSGSSTSQEVVGLLSNSLPSLAPGFLNWTGTAWAFSSAGTGTVTGVSIASANGFSGSSSGGATPALTIVAGAITPSSVAATGAISGTTGTFSGAVTTNSASNLCGTSSPCIAGVEGATAPTAAAGDDFLFMSSTAHALELSDNGSTLEPIPALNGSFTAGHALAVNAQLGSGSAYDIKDTGYSATAIPFADLSITSANIYGLWTGTCSSSTYLNGAGACGTPGTVTVVSSGNLTSGAAVTGGGSQTIQTPTAISGHYLRGNGTNYVDNTIQAGDLPAQTANTVLANITSGSAAPTANAIPAGIQNYVTSTGYNAATAHQLAAPKACADTSGSATAQSCTTSPSFTPAAGDCVIYTTTTANTGTGLTLNVNSLGAKSVAKWQTSTTLAANDVRANTENLACYDGTNWEIDKIGNAPSGTGNLSGTWTSTGNLVTTDGAATAQDSGIYYSPVYLSSSMSAQTTATPTPITGMAWNLAASTNYALTCQIAVTLATTATIAFDLNGPGSPTSYTLTYQGGIGSAGSSAARSVIGATSWGTATPASLASAESAVVVLTAGIQNGTTASGTQLQLRTIANGTNALTVLKDSFCTLTTN